MACLIPILSALFYRFGGQDQWGWCFLNQKIWRYLMGVPIALITGNWWAIPTYFFIAWVYVYGKTSWLNFLGEYGKFLVSGMALGACSFIILPFGIALLQTIFSGISFVVIKYFDDKGKIQNPFVEWGRGFFSTIFYIF